MKIECTEPLALVNISHEREQKTLGLK